MYAGTTTHGARNRMDAARAAGDVAWHKAYVRRKWRNRFLRIALWGTALALAIAILMMVGS
jgi:hypothetical protein